MMMRRTSSTGAIATGFTLIELMVVIFLLTLVATVSVTRFSEPSESTLVKAETRKVVSHLRSARSQAVRQNRVLQVQALDDNTGYRVLPDQETIELPELVSLSLLPGSGKALALANGRPSIQFYPDGSSSGELITLSGGHHAFHLQLDWLTGGITITEGLRDDG